MVKKHFKLYKAGKLWLVGAVATMGIMAASTQQAHADTTANQSVQAQQVGTNASYVNAAMTAQPAAQQNDQTQKPATDQGALSATKNNGTEYTQNGNWYLKNTQNQNLNGWQKLDDNRIVYYDTSNNAMAHGEKQINNNWYHFAENNGQVSTGFTDLNDGRRVYYNDAGQMQHGFTQVQNKTNNTTSTYHFAENNGDMTKGETKLNGHWYNFGTDGKMMISFNKLADGRTVYYNDQGQMQHGFTKVPNKDGETTSTYYFAKNNGDMTKGETKLNGHWYNFGTDGKMMIGFNKLADGRTVYYNDQGQMQHGFTKVPNKDEKTTSTYHFAENNGDMSRGLTYDTSSKTLKFFNTKGVLQSGKVPVGNQTYTFDPKTGSLTLGKAGEVKINGNWYFLNANNTLATGFKKLADGRTVYYDPATATMAHGEKKIGNNWYFFGQNSGNMATNFTKLPDGRSVYYNAKGQMLHGEQNISGNWYFFAKNNGDMAKGFTKLPDGRTVYYNNLGRMLHGEKNISGNWYFFAKNNGDMAKGFKKLADGRTVYYNNQGQMVHGHVTVDGHSIYANAANGNVERVVDETWAWPFPNVGEGHFSGAQLFGVNPGGQFRMNGFHDGLDFGSYDHPGSEVHAIHSGTVKIVGYGSGLDWYAVVDTGEYLVVYQEAFANRSNIWVHEGQKINVGDVIGIRNTSHVHIGITRNHNFNVALASSFINNGTWLNPLTIIRNGSK